MAFSAGAGGNDKENATINVVPLIDVLLVLLIIFMVTAPLMSHKVEVKLPEVNIGKTDDKVPPAPPVTLAIKENGSFFLNDVPKTREQLESDLSVIAQQVPQPTVNVRGDRTTKYRIINEAVGIAQKQGIRKVGFVAEREKR